MSTWQRAGDRGPPQEACVPAQTPPESQAAGGGGESVSAALCARLRDLIDQSGGWIGFDRFMHEALYAPGLGYYARGARIFGTLPGDGSDFVTAAELSALFGRALARQVLQGLRAAGSAQVLEFGAGSGALASQLLQTLGDRIERYSIVEVSGAMRARQQQRLAPWGDKLQWLEQLPQRIEGVVLGNEVLDAMPVRLLAYDGHGWSERGVVNEGPVFAFGDRPTSARPPADVQRPPGSLTELHEQSCAFVATLAERLHRGLALFIDYGFPQDEYHHPQRVDGTLMCHRAHRADADPLSDVGLKDITAHVDFTAVALSAQQAGLQVLGYTSQAHFLLNCGIAEMLAQEDLRGRAHAQKLLTEHEMGELFKVIAFGRGIDEPLIGFSRGDRTHRL